jgi:beta-phosphoglucomutase-like phosphatase (HAD superfamily)
MPGRAREEDQGRILADVLARAHAAAPRGVAVFDLDSTLLDNRPRQARILQDYGATWRIPKLRGARPEHWQGWDLAVALANAGLTPEEVRLHHPRARRFWAERFFTSDYCRLDVPLPGAAEYVRAIAEVGARIAYVTGRPRQMRAGTLEVLRRFGFPLPGEARAALLMKPRLELGDEAWKTLARGEVERLGAVFAAFDNEPAHVNGYALAWPRAICVHLDTDHSGRPVEVLARIPSIQDFRSLAPLSAAATAATAPAP